MEFECPKCHGDIEVADESAGSSVECPLCGDTVSVPIDQVVTMSDDSPRGAVSAAELKPGTMIGKCRIERELGRGGMGVVYLATHTHLDLPVAVKILPAHVAKEDPDFVKRFVREARLAAKIQHPNVVAVMDVDQDPETGLNYIVMQYVDGSTVKDLVADGPADVDKALEITAAVANALVKAAELKIVHRDIKPGNILLTAAGEPKLADLGLAKRTDADGTVVTVSSSSLGTPAYMSLEQIEHAGSIDTRADIYSLGATLFHMLTGRPPFKGESTYSIISKVVAGPTPDPRDVVPDLPEPVVLVCLKAMARDREGRYQTPKEFLDDLGKVRGGVSDVSQIIASEQPRGSAGQPATMAEAEKPKSRGISFQLGVGKYRFALKIALTAFSVLILGVAGVGIFGPEIKNSAGRVGQALSGEEEAAAAPAAIADASDRDTLGDFGNGGIASAGLEAKVSGLSVRLDFTKREMQLRNVILNGSEGLQWNPYYSVHRLAAPGAWFRGTFNSDSAGTCTMTVTHQTSGAAEAPNGGFSPVNINVNGTIVAANFDPAANHDGDLGPVVNTWEVPLKKGENTFIWIAQRIATHYWIRKIEFTEAK